jgi:chromosomal replication initiation ATPase DnaA
MTVSYMLFPAILKTYCPYQSLIGDVCKASGISYKVLMSKSRIRGVVEVRHIICHLLINRFGLEVGQIGKLLLLTHSSVIYAIKQVNILKKTNGQFRMLYENLESATT